MKSEQPAVLLLCRFLLAFLFIYGGWGKLMNPAGFAAQMAHEGMPFSDMFPWLAIIIEIGGGLALLFGVFTGPVALLFVPYILVATFIDHRFWEMQMPASAINRVMFTKNLAICGGMFLLWLQGAGAWSIDAMRATRRA